MNRQAFFSLNRCLKYTSSIKPVRNYAIPAGTLDVGGIYPPIATPFNKNEDIDYTRLKENMDIWSKIPFKGII